MSLILEALRKSEAERRRGDAPDVLSAMPPQAHAHARATPGWMWLLAGSIALLVLLALAWQLLAPPYSSLPVAAPAAPSATKPVALPAPAPALESASAPAPVPMQSPASIFPHVARLTPAPVLPAADENKQATTLSGADRTPESSRGPLQPIVPTPASTSAPTSAATIDSPTATPRASPGGDIESLSDLSPAERRLLPPLRLSMHLWNPDPARRFVILDGNRLGEGDRTDDVIVSAITADGVVLDWRGRRLKLPIR